MDKTGNIDDIDRNILSILMKNSNTSYAVIAKQLFVSSGTVHVRMTKLKEMGIVTGANLTIDHTKLGYDVVAFLGVFLEKSSQYDDVSERLKMIPEIVSAHYTTGNYGIFVKIVCKDTLHLRTVLHDKIQRIAGIQRTETMISLEESINRPLTLEKKEE
jgi:Lrp/AsnC family transcriptional regulator for asnA, asnC and gidA